MDFFGITDADGNEWADSTDWTPGDHIVSAQIANLVDYCHTNRITMWLDGTEVHARRENDEGTD